MWYPVSNTASAQESETVLFCDATLYVGRVLPIAAGHPEGWTNYTKSLRNFSQRQKCYLLCKQSALPKCSYTVLNFIWRKDESIERAEDSDFSVLCGDAVCSESRVTLPLNGLVTAHECPLLAPTAAGAEGSSRAGVTLCLGFAPRLCGAESKPTSVSSAPWAVCLRKARRDQRSQDCGQTKPGDSQNHSSSFSY